MSRLDIVIFGATGYTGKFVVRELARTYRDENITWGIAGRSKDKLESVLNSISSELGIDLNLIEKIVADVKDEESIKLMCQKASIVINCVGPYRFYGEIVIKQCVENGTHHLDVSGEPEYLERMQLLYDHKAFENGVFIIGSCGFDSVPADLGVLFMQDNFKNDLSCVESYLSFDFGNKPASFNYATWESAVYGFASAKNLGKIRRELFKTRLPKPEYRVSKKTNFFGYFYDQSLKKYCMDFMGSDKSVVQRTQYFSFNILNRRSIQYSPYFTIGSLFYTSVMIIWGLSFSFLANNKFGRSLLLKFYKFFSFGLASKKETTIEQMEGITFKMEFRGIGFDKKLESKTQEFKEPPNQVIITEVSGMEPGYVSTSKIVLKCAFVLLRESAKIQVKGGVLTPGAAFCKTSLIDRLKNDGFDFKVIRNDSIAKANL
ncbi:unnamed protein product [Brachionus calyciflorus]|uniref:Saccharopine dehydrogenase NADP binding domain-containing protein n=1 Tax=Brachionus calyciflorus TaxID=104777 RepID=A0A813TI44_9BILA|nr:unnamed protein product [Brachionus calyciflorus]